MSEVNDQVHKTTALHLLEAYRHTINRLINDKKTEPDEAQSTELNNKFSATETE